MTFKPGVLPEEDKRLALLGQQQPSASAEVDDGDGKAKAKPARRLLKGAKKKQVQVMSFDQQSAAGSRPET